MQVTATHIHSIGLEWTSCFCAALVPTSSVPVSAVLRVEGKPKSQPSRKRARKSSGAEQEAEPPQDDAQPQDERDAAELIGDHCLSASDDEQVWVQALWDALNVEEPDDDGGVDENQTSTVAFETVDSVVAAAPASQLARAPVPGCDDAWLASFRASCDAMKARDDAFVSCRRFACNGDVVLSSRETMPVALLERPGAGQCEAVFVYAFWQGWCHYARCIQFAYVAHGIGFWIHIAR